MDKETQVILHVWLPWMNKNKGTYIPIERLTLAWSRIHSPHVAANVLSLLVERGIISPCLSPNGKKIKGRFSYKGDNHAGHLYRINGFPEDAPNK